MKKQDFHLPECGMYFGSAVYVSFKDYTIGLGRMFTCWNPEGHTPNWFIDRTIEEKGHDQTKHER